MELEFWSKAMRPTPKLSFCALVKTVTSDIFCFGGSLSRERKTFSQRRAWYFSVLWNDANEYSSSEGFCAMVVDIEVRKSDGTRPWLWPPPSHVAWQGRSLKFKFSSKHTCQCSAVQFSFCASLCWTISVQRRAHTVYYGIAVQYSVQKSYLAILGA